MARLKETFKRILPHVGSLTAVIIYTVIGGYIFYVMEKPYHNTPRDVISTDMGEEKDVHMNMSEGRSARETPLDQEKCPMSKLILYVTSSIRECASRAVYEKTNSVERVRDCDTLLSSISECLQQGVAGPLSAGAVTQPSQKHLDGITTTVTTSTRKQPYLHKGDSKLNEWTLKNCIFMAFTIISTIGYGHVAPVTEGGRLFCIVYGLIGIPLALLAIANLGRFLSSAILFVYHRVLRLAVHYSPKLASKIDTEETSDKDDEPMPVLLLLTIFASYILAGGCLFIQYEKNWSYVDAIYFIFISSSTIGFGDILPKNEAYLPLTLLYIALGLVLATTAADVLAEYLRRLHHWGARIRNCKNILLRFGSEQVTMAHFVRSIGLQFGVPEEKITKLVDHLDDVVEKTIRDITPVPTPTPQGSPRHAEEKHPLQLDAFFGDIAFIDM